jgi:hypothetical protein
MTRISPLSTIVAMPDLLVTVFDDEFVILNLKNGVYYGLADVGAWIWQLLQKPITSAAICAAITSEFAVPAEASEHDVARFVTELATHGLIEVRNPDKA